MPSHNLRGVVATFGGITLGGYDGDDAISYEWQGQWADSTNGADGVTIAYPMNDRRIRVTTTLQQTSPAYSRMMDLWRNDDALVQAGGAMPTHAFLMRTGANEKISGSAVFIDRPTPNASRAPTARVFVFEIATPDYVPPAP